jgi:hypothetical protein
LLTEMKIRIQNNTVRVRLNEREVAELDQGMALSSETSFPGSRLNFSLRSGEYDQTSFDNNSVKIIVSNEKVTRWANTEEVTIAMEFKISDEEKLSILVEKDMKI